jgi:Amt family ammonium transporter
MAANMCAQISIGCVRARFARHIAVLILIDACASALGFYLFGFAFAFGDETDDAGNVAGNPFIGSQYFALHGLDGPTYFATAVRPYAFWVFEWAVRLPCPAKLPIGFYPQ